MIGITESESQGINEGPVGFKDIIIDGDESFQLQMGLSFPFLRANNLCTSLFIMRTLSLSYVVYFSI